MITTAKIKGDLHAFEEHGIGIIVSYQHSIRICRACTSRRGYARKLLSKVRINVTLQEPLAVEVDTPELEQQQQNMGLLQAHNHKLRSKTATTEMVDVLEIDVPEVE